MAPCPPGTAPAQRRPPAPSLREMPPMPCAMAGGKCSVLGLGAARTTPGPCDGSAVQQLEAADAEQLHLQVHFPASKPSLTRAETLPGTRKPDPGPPAARARTSDRRGSATELKLHTTAPHHLPSPHSSAASQPQAHGKRNQVCAIPQQLSSIPVPQQEPAALWHVPINGAFVSCLAAAGCECWRAQTRL